MKSLIPFAVAMTVCSLAAWARRGDCQESASDVHDRISRAASSRESEYGRQERLAKEAQAAEAARQAKAARQAQAYRERMAKTKFLTVTNAITTEELFPNKTLAEPYGVGQIGVLSNYHPISVVQVADSHIMIDYMDKRLLLRGVDSKNLATDDLVALSAAVKIIKIETHETKSGLKTFYVLQPIVVDPKFLKKLQEEKEAAAAAELKAEAQRKVAEEKAKWRTWTDSSGTRKIEAKFSCVIAGKVKLIKQDGVAVQVPIDNLSEADRDWIQNRTRKGNAALPEPTIESSKNEVQPSSVDTKASDTAQKQPEETKKPDNEVATRSNEVTELEKPRRQQNSDATKPEQLRQLLLSRPWTRVQMSGKSQGHRFQFVFNADGTCVGKRGDATSSVKHWRFDNETLILGSIPYNYNKKDKKFYSQGGVDSYCFE